MDAADQPTGRGRRIEGHFLRSRVARRIFASVLLCTLLPTLGFALLSLHEVTDEIEREAETRLGQDAKQIGMTVLEKLLLADATLHVLDEALRHDATDPSIAKLPPSLRALAQGRFRSFAVSQPDGRTAGPPSLLTAFADPSREDVQHLTDGGAWLRVIEGRQPRIVLAHRAAGAADGPLVAAEIEPRFLFPDEALRSGVELAVVTERGQSVFHTAGAEPVGGHGTSARFGGWPRAYVGEDSLAGAWMLFLQPVLRAPAWGFVVSEPRAVVLAPVQQFRSIFPLVTLLSLFGVGLASLVLIRRQLVPIETLHDATRRMAEKDFTTRVDIRSSDEFQDLGRSFNQMAENIAQHVAVMETVNAVGTALSVERDHDRLLATMLRGAMAATGAPAGALHLVTVDDRLERRLLRSADGQELLLAERFDVLAARAAEGAEATFGDGILSIPMRNQEGEGIGVLQLMPGAETGSFSREERSLAESLASQTAVALTRDRLADEFRGLFEGLIQLLVRAIDEKSPYTGAHCRRVPVLTEMIADAVCGSTDGPLKEFTLSDAERYELRIAALLHDCGKVTTPVHVQDKATKLECLFDRIDLVDVRFEVVRRDLLLENAAGGDPAAIEASLRRLDEDRSFLRACNLGGEFMDRALQDRVREIAARWRWRAPDGVVRPILEAPEVENLCIERGTLNEAEREIINQHVVATIQMLEQLPYPRSLRNVPFIAGAHHERMDGCGYPNQLTREEMSVQARILGLADVFEALTAKDRPYKPGMRVRTALEILGRMKDEGHIDGDLFDVFVREKIHLRYAARWLDPEQIDEDLLDEAAVALIAEARREPRN